MHRKLAITVNGKTRKAMADQLTTASKRRLQNRIGRLDRDALDALEHAIKVQLRLN
jgi:mRNA interferase MazF